MEKKFKKDASFDDKTPNKFRKESKKVCAFCVEKNDVVNKFEPIDDDNLPF